MPGKKDVFRSPVCSRNSRTFGSVLIISILNNGLNLLGVSSFYALVDPAIAVVTLRLRLPGIKIDFG